MTVLEVNIPWMMSAYELVRKAMIEQSSVSVSAALSIAYLVLVFKLANIAFRGMSDEQGAGYGGIKLMDIIRPLILVFAIQNAPTVCSVVDSVSCTIASAITDSISETKRSVDASTYVLKQSYAVYGKYSALAKDIIEGGLTGRKLEDVLRQYGLSKTQYAITGTGIGAGDMGASIAVQKGNADLLFTILGETMSANADIGAKDAEALAGSEEIDSLESESPDLVDIIRGSGGTTQALSWLFNIMRQAMLTFSQILLIILAFFLPWTLLFSIFEKWKNAWVGWMGRYVQISMWPVTISLIWFSVYTLIDGVKSNMLLINYKEIADAVIQWKEACMNGTVTAAQAAEIAKSIDKCDSYFMMYSGIALAGVIALCKISSIVEMIFPMPEGGSGTGDAGSAMAGGVVTVMQKGGNAAGNTVTMGTKTIPAIGKAIGGAQKAAGAAGDVMKGMTR